MESNGRVVYTRELTGLIRIEQYENGKTRVWHHLSGSFYCESDEADELFDVVENGYEGGCINCGVVRAHDECGGIG